MHAVNYSHVYYSTLLCLLKQLMAEFQRRGNVCSFEELFVSLSLNWYIITTRVMTLGINYL